MPFPYNDPNFGRVDQGFRLEPMERQAWERPRDIIKEGILVELQETNRLLRVLIGKTVHVPGIGDGVLL